MRNKYLLIVTALCLLFTGAAFAQLDTLVVPATDDLGEYWVNSLIEFVVGDTNEAGEQLHDVYKLESGQLYLLDQAMDLRNPIVLVADAPVANNPEMLMPKILSNTTEDGGASTMNLINTWEDITLRNIWLGGMSINGAERGWGLGNALAVLDSFVTVRMENVYMDYNGWSAIGTSQPHTSWFINNVHARNEQNPGDVWTTFLFYLEGSAVVDTFVVKNSTYFQSNSFFLFPPDVVSYLEVDHCTFVNLLKWPFHSTQWLTAKITNNIFYNVSALSLTENEEEGQDSDNLEVGLVNIDTLVANESDTIDATPYTIPEDDRVFEVKNNLYFWSQGVQDYWANNDSVKATLWMNSRTVEMFADDAAYPNLVEENNWNQDPMFNDFPGLADATQKLSDVLVSFRAGTMYQWDWDSDMEEYPEFYEVIYEYPLPENFKSSAGLLGTDGLPIGSLVYEPEIWSGVEEETSTPADFTLQQNYPNPFNPVTTINYSVQQRGNVTLTVYNMLGEKVRTLVNNSSTPGSYSVTWNATNDDGVRVSSGVYFYQLETQNSSVMKKMVLIK